MVNAELARTVEREIENSDCPRLEAEYMIMAAYGMSRAEYLIKKRCEVPPEIAEAVLSMAGRRKAGEPLAYILGSAEFMGLEFKVTRDTLIPRADTETLAEAAIREIGGKSARVLDIGAGTGCVGISIGHFCRNASVTLLDISAGALAAAGENAEKNGVKAEIIRCDILNKIPSGEYDVIVSNPPYIRADIIKTLQTEVRDFEPRAALDGGADGLLFYRRIAEISKKILASDGLLMFEIGFDQAEDVTEIMSDYKAVRVLKDLCGSDRVVYGYKK